MTARFLVGSLLLCLLATAGPAADQPAEKKEGFVDLFNGKDLTGWVVTACKVGVENGNLVILEGNGLVRPDRQFGDFVLELEWKNRKAEKFDSGIYFRSEKLRVGKRWPDKHQINLLDGQEGSLVGNKDAAVKGLAKAGEWNALQLTVIGEKAELTVNGKLAWKVEGIKPTQGYIGIQCEVPGGGQFEFRNIRIKAMTPPVVDEKEE